MYICQRCLIVSFAEIHLEIGRDRVGKRWGYMQIPRLSTDTLTDFELSHLQIGERRQEHHETVCHQEHRLQTGTSRTEVRNIQEHLSRGTPEHQGWSQGCYSIEFFGFMNVTRNISRVCLSPVYGILHGRGTCRSKVLL